MNNMNSRWWILLQGGAIVAGILLAFGIEAWWSEREERSTEQKILRVLDAEMQLNLSMIEEEISYHSATREAIAQIFRAAAGNLELSEEQVDVLFADLLWWSEPEFAIGALVSLVDGGQIGIVDDSELALQKDEHGRNTVQYRDFVLRDEAQRPLRVKPILKDDSRTCLQARQQGSAQAEDVE